MIVLASQSPRRQELMHQISGSFIVDVPHIDESASLSLPPLEAVRDISKRKGMEVAKRHHGDLIISADTIVVLDDEIIGKPKDEEDAYKMLKKLSGKMHKVITAFCLIKSDRLYQKSVISEVYFNELSDELIKEYIKTGSPLDKAGGYGVQDNDKYPLVKKVVGSIDNVIGFPVEEIKETIAYFEKIA